MLDLRSCTTPKRLVQDSVLAAIATALLDSHIPQGKAANRHPYDVPVQRVPLLAPTRSVSNLSSPSPAGPCFLGTYHNFFSHSTVLTTGVDKINHPKSHNTEMPSDFSCWLLSEWLPHPPRLCHQVHLPVPSTSGPVEKSDLFPAEGEGLIQGCIVWFMSHPKTALRNHLPPPLTLPYIV